MFALTGIFAGFLERAATCGELIVVDGLMRLSASSALLVIKSTPAGPMCPGPALLTLRDELPLFRVFDLDKLTSYVVDLVDDIFSADTLLRVPHTSRKTTAMSLEPLHLTTEGRRTASSPRN